MIDKSKYTDKEIRKMIDDTKHELVIAERDLDVITCPNENRDQLIYIKALWELLTELRDNKRFITN